MGKRVFDIVFSSIGLIILSPFLLLIAMLIIVDSRGGVFFRQQRVGKGEVFFYLLKFRTMSTNAERQGQLTIGERDRRITRIGYWLRKFKLDEFPQLINVLAGDMSLVGPRPEVPKYVNLYSDEQKQILSVRPGITDYASIEYVNENEILGKATDPEKVYIEEIMPAKLELNRKYINEKSLGVDLKIIFQTLGRIFN